MDEQLTARRFHATIAAVCPIVGIGWEDGQWRIDPAPEASPEQIAAAAVAREAFDPSTEAQAAWDRQQAINAAFVPMFTSSPTVDALRATFRAETDLLNMRLRALSALPILDAEIMPVIGAYILSGEGFPDRPV